MLGNLNSKASILSLGWLMVIAIFLLSILSNSSINNYSKSALAQPFIQTVKHRDLVIDLGDGIQTKAQLTIPAVGGNGPFPGVLLIAGSGIRDMNESLDYIRIDNQTGSKIYPPTPFFQVAEYLSERGFVVLRYDKRDR